MRTFLLAATAALALGAAAPAFAGEGNGPSFPGLNAVSTGITTRLSDGSTFSSTVLLANSSGVQGGNDRASRSLRLHNQARAMIASLSGFGRS